MLVVDELQNPAKYGLASMLRAGATIRFARANEIKPTVIPDDLAVAANSKVETAADAGERRMTMSVELIPGSNRLVTTIESAENAAVVFHIPAWWSDAEASAAPGDSGGDSETYV